MAASEDLITGWRASLALVVTRSSSFPYSAPVSVKEVSRELASATCSKARTQGRQAAAPSARELVDAVTGSHLAGRTTARWRYLSVQDEITYNVAWPSSPPAGRRGPSRAVALTADLGATNTWRARRRAFGA